MRMKLLAVVVALLVCGPAFADGSVSCQTRDIVRAWASSQSLTGKWRTSETAKYIRTSTQSVEDQLTALCSEPDAKETPSAQWLVRSDQAAQDLLALGVMVGLYKPLRGELMTTALAYNDYLNGLRARAYERVQVQTKEVVRTVEVPANCPPPPDPDAECDRQLRAAAKRWASAATDILGGYGETGRMNDAFKVVVRVRREMNDIPSDVAMYPLAVSWAEQLRRAANDPVNVKRTGSTWDFFQLTESEQSRINGLAEDIRSQLHLCRRY